MSAAPSVTAMEVSRQTSKRSDGGNRNAAHEGCGRKRQQQHEAARLRRAAAGFEEVVETEGGAAIDAVVERLARVCQPPPAARRLQAKRVPDVTLPARAGGDALAKRWLAESPFHVGGRRQTVG